MAVKHAILVGVGGQGAILTAKVLVNGLMKAGYDLPRFGADGSYGAETVSAVKAFQKANGLQQDGIIGPKTWAKLLESKQAEVQQKYTVTIRDLDKTTAEEITAKYGGEMIAEE